MLCFASVFMPENCRHVNESDPPLPHLLKFLCSGSSFFFFQCPSSASVTPSLRYIVIQLRKVFSLRVIPAVSLFLLNEKMFGIGGGRVDGLLCKEAKAKAGVCRARWEEEIEIVLSISLLLPRIS